MGLLRRHPKPRPSGFRHLDMLLLSELVERGPLDGERLAAAAVRPVSRDEAADWLADAEERGLVEPADDVGLRCATAEGARLVQPACCWR